MIFYKRLIDQTKNLGAWGPQVYPLATPLHFLPLLMRRPFYLVIISFAIIIFYVWLSNHTLKGS